MFTYFAIGFFCIISINAQVLEFTDQDYSRMLEKYQKVLIMYYSPGCGHCKMLKPTYEMLPGRKDIQESGVAIARVDCSSKGSKTCQQEEIRGFPSVKLVMMNNGKKDTVEYNGNRELTDLAKFVIENTKPIVQEVSGSLVPTFIESDTLPVVLGFFDNEKSSLLKELIALAPSFKKYFIFGYTFCKAATEKLGHKKETVSIYRQQHFKTLLDTEILSESNKKKLEKFLDTNKHSLVELRTVDNEGQFSASDLVVVFVPFSVPMKKSQFKQVRNRIFKVAKIFKHVQFAISQRQEYSEFIDSIPPNYQKDDLILVAFSKSGQKYVCDKFPSLKDLKSFETTLSTFVEDYLKGDVYKPHIKSEAVPEYSEDPVKVVVAKTFDSIVMDESKDVLIEFYAPWCGHCKKLEPIYIDLAIRLSGEENIVIAKIDATANEIHKNFAVQGFPTIYLAKAKDKSKPVQYTGERTVLDMLQWLKKEASFPIQYDEKESEGKVEL